MQAHDLDAPNIDTVLDEPRGRSRELLDALEAALQSPDPDKRCLEDDPPIGVEDGPPTNEYDVSISVMPSDSKRTPSASLLFVFLFFVLTGVGSAFAWRFYHFYNEIERLEKNNGRITADGGQATEMITASALPSATSKPTTPPEDFAEVQQQLKSIASDLVAVRNTLEQQSVALRNTLEHQSAANHDQLTRIQEQISRQGIALLSASPLADKPVRTPLPKPAQQPAHITTQDSSKPIQVVPPLPPKQ